MKYTVDITDLDSGNIFLFIHLIDKKSNENMYFSCQKLPKQLIFT